MIGVSSTYHDRLLDELVEVAILDAWQRTNRKDHGLNSLVHGIQLASVSAI